jgi:hypothetical protein
MMKQIKIGKMSKRQKFFSFMCKKLAGDEFEERATNLLPEEYRIKGFRLWLYWQFRHLQAKEADRLVKKYKTHNFK